MIEFIQILKLQYKLSQKYLGDEIEEKQRTLDYKLHYLFKQDLTLYYIKT